MKRWIFWVGIAISVLFLFWALQGLHLPEVWQSIQGAKLIWLLPAVLVYFVDVIFRSLRWQILLRPAVRLDLKKVFPVISIGYLGNNIFPARAGELLRAILLKRRYQVPVATTLATILVERIFDGVTMLGFIFFNLSALSGLSADSGFVGSIQSLAFWGALAFMGALVFLMLAAIFPIKVESISSGVIHTFLPKNSREPATNIVNRFIGGLDSLRNPREAILVLLASLSIWLLETMTYWFVMQAFPFEVSLFALMLMNGIVNLSTTLPSAPGYIGVFDAPGIALLSAYGIPPETAAGYTILLHITLWLPITLVGAYFFAREGLNWSRELEQAREERKKIR
ncbi:MAG: flippase-like domain-containing protein [Chloroflexi bacterium]|nr:flippase-like domain-containing protein [Chloroflexota bacterium]